MPRDLTRLVLQAARRIPCAVHVPPCCRGGRRSVSECKKGFHAEFTHYVKKNRSSRRPRTPKRRPRITNNFTRALRNKGNIIPKSREIQQQLEQNRTKVIHGAPEAPLEGKVVVFDTQCTFKWSTNGIESKKKAKEV